MKRACCALCLCILGLVLFCACSSANEEAPDVSSEAEIVTVTPIPQASENENTPESTPGFSINPVSAFYSMFSADTRNAFRSYRLGLFEGSGVNDLRSLLDFEEHLTYVLRPNASIGRLCASGGAYSDTLFGAARGSGTLTPQNSDDAALASSLSESAVGAEDVSGENLRASGDSFTFSFSYNEGYSMRGYLRSDMLYYSVRPILVSETVKKEVDEESGHEAEIVSSTTSSGDFLYGAYLKKGPGEQWTSIVLVPDYASLVSFENDKVQFHSRTLDERFFDILQALSFEELYSFILTGSAGSDGQLT